MVTVSVLLLLLSVFSPPVHNNLTTFHVIPDKMNQTDARAACRGNYTDLVTVYSDEDNTELYNLMMKAGGGAGRWDGGWIGLYRGQFSEKWSNGDPVTFSNLTGDCGTWSCCAAMKPDGSWESLHCTGTRYFMCYEQNASSKTPNYHLILESKTWYEAQRYCRGRYTDLISIRDQQQNGEVKIKGLNSSTSFWIGLLCDDWQWTDGGNSAYRNWASGHPQPSPYDCVRMWQNASSQTPNYHLILENKTWYGAQRYCRGRYTDLVSIRDQQQNKEVKIKGLNSSTSFWIGLLRDDWQWTDGGNSAYRNWDWWRGEPLASPYDCVEMHLGKWYSAPCSNYYYLSLCYSSSIHVSAEALSWQEALGYCNEGNRIGILNIDSKAEQEEVESELRRRRVPPGSPLWVGLGPNRLSERQTGPGPSHCPADTHTAEAAPDYVMDSDKLRVVCKLK
ncbi:macrophage mannose receptor 1-like [Clarias gariepinus]|uniref:macrophage mannose receptor 1-like n=1 Tax=Clarias gariepinus TaxID=13013 RepID=UPI00234C0B73|nr:macrophage mannose receptor 1-like [Clarias gariepinus]